MIITKLTLGLGNNLFQYALGRRLALERSTELLLDFTGENYNRRQYCLSYMSHFNMIRSVAKTREVMKIKLLNRFSFINPDYENSVIKENGNIFDQTVINAPKNAYLIGYWQSEKYFKPIENILRHDLTFKEPQNKKYQDLLDKITRSNSVSIHVRRGDYMLSKNLCLFNICKPDYYHKAVVYISGEKPAPELFIFSDDIKWVKQNIKFNFPTTFVSDGSLTDYQELILMSVCKHNIIANSTFSWWSSWLATNPDKIVIAPEKYALKINRPIYDYYPESWKLIKINYKYN